MPRSSLFKFAINDEVAWWYAKAGLLSFHGKLFLPCCDDWVQHLIEIRYRFAGFVTFENGEPPTCLSITDMNYTHDFEFIQNPLYTFDDLGTDELWERRYEYFIRQDQLTPRVLRLQRFFRQCIMNKRKHLLTVLLAAVPVKNPDVAGLIAQWL